MAPKPDYDPERPLARDLSEDSGNLASGFGMLGWRCALAVLAMGAGYEAYTHFGGSGLYVFMLLFGAWWLHRELAWIEANVPPEE